MIKEPEDANWYEVSVFHKHPESKFKADKTICHSKLNELFDAPEEVKK
tara:strand:+ start:1188 stop:1331 length:144 start_codon:yes stop_codon:yes gene_type:complete